MSLLTVVIVILVVGIVLWLINSQIPMQPTVKKILNVVVIVVLCVWILKALGAWQYLASVHL